MASIAIAGQPFGINYTALDGNNDLFVQAAVYDVTAGVPGTFLGTIDMLNTTVGSYDATYTFPTEGHLLKIAQAVYTDDTYTILNPNYAPQSEYIQTIALNPVAARTKARVVNPVFIPACER